MTILSPFFPFSMFYLVTGMSLVEPKYTLTLGERSSPYVSHSCIDPMINLGAAASKCTLGRLWISPVAWINIDIPCYRLNSDTLAPIIRCPSLGGKRIAVRVYPGKWTISC